MASAPVAKHHDHTMHFFVHHTSSLPRQSPHLLDLKNKRANIWENVETVAPEANHSFYHTYHQRPAEAILPARPAEKNEVPLQIVTPEDGLSEIIRALPKTKIEPAKKLKKNTVKRIRAKKEKNPGFNFDSAFTRTAYKVEERIRALPALLPSRRAMAVILLVVFLGTLPFQARGYYQDLNDTAKEVASDGTGGFLDLQASTAAMMQADLPAAAESLANASDRLNRAVDTMSHRHALLQKFASFVPFLSDQVKSRESLLLAGQKIAQGNKYLLLALQEDKNTGGTLTKKIPQLSSYLKSAQPDYEEALYYLSAVRIEDIPVEYQKTFSDFRLLFTAVLGDLKQLSSVSDTLSEIFGGAGRRRYLLAFQNPYELRPTGGFMGSFAVLEIKDGEIVSLNVPAGGSYDLQGQLSEFVEPPAPLLLSNKRWEFQDANWFPDFPASAQKMLWFYRKSRSNSLDGVIAINAPVLEKLLAISGPITDTKRNLTISADNALPVLQTVVETGPEKALNKPKQILADLAPQILGNFQTTESSKLIPLLTALSEALQTKDIQAYFADAGAQALVQNFGWDGRILPTRENQDYLLVVNTNIQGEKSDAEIKQTISHEAAISPDGSVINTVTVTREHTGTAGEKLYGQTNIDFIRLYVPQGSELLSAQGFTWPDEKKFRAPADYEKKDADLLKMEKEVAVDPLFGNWIITEPGEKNIVQFVYRLPFKIMAMADNNPEQSWNKLFTDAQQTLGYQLVIQRQSGAVSTFESQIILPDGFEPVWQEGDGSNLATNGLAIDNQPLTHDKIFSLIAKKIK